MGNKSKTRILHVSTKEIGLVDIPRALDEMGYDVYHAQLGITALDFIKEDSDKISEAIEDYKVDYVTTYDFSESVAEACMKKSIPYISWVYDSPQKELYAYQAHYPSNYIFAFDKTQCEQLKQSGLKNVFHMPLAIHGEKVRRDLRKFPVGESHDIVFIGQLYKVKSLNEVIEQAPEVMKLEIKSSIDNLFMKWDGKNKVYGSLSDDAAAFFNKYSERNLTQRYPYMPHGLYYEATVLSRVIANRERVHILNKLAENYDVNFYTRDKDVSQLNDKVKIHPGIGYDAGITAIYRDAKINLNITLHCIETGASQRIFDVMAAGGFMLSNYQKELEELFIPGEEIVLYHNEEELMQYVEYYLLHEDERKEIARRGQEKVLRLHSFHGKFKKVFDIVSMIEKEKKCSYIEMQSMYLYEEAQYRLKMGDIQFLYDIFENPLYNLTIKHDDRLTKLYEMLYCWKNEKENGEPTIFENVTSVETAVLKYDKVAETVKMIEEGCDNQIAIDSILDMDAQGVSNFFMAWQINNNTNCPKEMFIKFANCLSQLNVYCAVELLDYALMIFNKDTNILITKANYYVQVNAYGEALEILEQIENPDENVKVIMQQLRNITGSV